MVNIQILGEKYWNMDASLKLGCIFQNIYTIVLAIHKFLPIIKTMGYE